MCNESVPLPVQIRPLMMKGTIIISKGQNPPSETFSYDEKHHHKRRHKSPSRKGLVNDAMSKALDRISKSPFTRKIEGAKLPRRFH